MKKKSKIIILNGSGGVGKTTFARLCKKHYTKTYNISTIDPIKKALQEMFVNINDKGEKTRKLMSDVKNLMTEYNECSKFYVQIKKNGLDKWVDNYILFVDSREPKEIKWFKENLNAKTLLIRNKNTKNIYSNMADRNVENFEYDFYIQNDGTLEDLELKAKNFIERILLSWKI